MRKAFVSLFKLGFTMTKVGVPLIVCGSTAVYIKNKVTGVR